MEDQRPIELLIATGLYPPDIGGPATYCRMLEEKLHSRTIRVTVVPFGKVRHLPKVIRHLCFFWILLKETRGKDALYALDPVSVGVPALLVAKITRTPFILRVAGDYAWEQAQLRFSVSDRLEVFYKKRFSYGFLVSILSFIESFVTRSANVVVIPCNYWKKILDVWGIEQERVHVIYSALSPLEVLATKEDLREQLQYRGFVITSAGRLVPNKGFVELIKVFAEITKERDDVSLVILGDGPQEAELKHTVKLLGLEAKVRFTGKVQKDTLGNIIKASDLFVLNTDHEGFSHQLLEVMDIGTPIITTDVGGNPELIEHQKTGLLIPFGDVAALHSSMLLLMANSPLRHTLSAHAKVKVKEFNDVDATIQFVQVLRNTLSWK